MILVTPSTAYAQVKYFDNLKYRTPTKIENELINYYGYASQKSSNPIHTISPLTYFLVCNLGMWNKVVRLKSRISI